ncbi:hypothetical protein [Metabacillus malikii]|uniref:Uncharacterized protein n=1 Tax=Metabacillus malikii TaxID=1504265 RepID=A0ABT9ZCJ5_9BACI|nr:hypothetical protein [Metabacillus malikii]MDQ0229973.1 hypothetical protein [Metabacillus malikii]
MIANYIGTTEKMLHSSSLSDKVAGMIHPKFRFNYRGDIELTDEIINLGNWKAIHLDDIQEIKCEFDETFKRLTVNGDNRLGYFSKGEPLILTLSNEKIYLLINWSFTTGFTDNKKWFEKIVEKIG